MFKRIILGVLLLGVLAVGIFYSMPRDEDENVDLLNKVLKATNYKGELIDYGNEIGVKSKEDIGYAINDGELVVYYGKLKFTMTKKYLEDKDFMDSLKKIGITIGYDKKHKKYVVKYKGDKLKQWVN